MTHDGLADQYFGAAAGMPGQVLRGPQRQLDTGGTADDADRFECVGGLHGTTGTPGAGVFPQPGRHDAHVLWLARQGGVQRRDLVVGGPPIVGDAVDGAGLLGGLHDLGDREQSDIDSPAGHVAAQRFQQPGQQRAGQVRTIGLQRVEHLGGGPARVIGRQSP